MDLVSPQVAAAGLKSAASLGRAVVGRYRPVGVPRTGSREDRAEAYRRMLDASTAAWHVVYTVNVMTHAGRAERRWAATQLTRASEVTMELIGALNHVRLCGTEVVVAAAEELVTATQELDVGARPKQLQEGSTALFKAQAAFLDVCREELAYNPRWWQFRRRRAMRAVAANKRLDA